MRLPGRRGERPPGRLRQRLATGLGLDELEELEQRLPALEEAVTENTRLAAPLERHVAALEQGLVPALEQALEEGAESGRGDDD